MKHRCALPWVDKYRPRSLKDVIGHDEIKSVLRKSIDTCDLPHLLFYGGSGTGKTSTVLALATQLYGPERLEQNVLELNASDENGINVVREKIISFAKLVVGSPDPKYPSPSFKLVILDEADSMTGDAQTALKKVMESTCEITRFIFICNYETKIIDPIKSRCASFRFNPIPEQIMMAKLEAIAKNEGMKIGSEALHTITDICNGDARQSIMTLQNLKYFDDEEITKETVYHLTSTFCDSYLDDVWDKCLTCNTTELTNIALTLTNTGYPISNIMECVKNRVINSTMSDRIKANICIYMANIERTMMQGSDNQLLAVLAFINGMNRGYDFENIEIF